MIINFCLFVLQWKLLTFNCKRYYLTVKVSSERAFTYKSNGTRYFKSMINIYAVDKTIVNMKLLKNTLFLKNYIYHLNLFCYVYEVILLISYQLRSVLVDFFASRTENEKIISPTKHYSFSCQQAQNCPFLSLHVRYWWTLE